MIKSAITVALTASLLAVGLFASAKAGLLSPFGIESSSSDSQVIRAVERTQEVSLVSLGIQGIIKEEKSRTVFGVSLPGSGEKVLIQYTFSAKLGIDGTKVQVEQKGEHSYRVSIPDFIFIGYDQPVFEEVAEDSGVLRALTEDIDRAEMINKVLDDDAQDDYIASNIDVLEDQTRVFYETLIKGVDTDASVAFTFSS